MIDEIYVWKSDHDTLHWGFHRANILSHGGAEVELKTACGIRYLRQDLSIESVASVTCEGCLQALNATYGESSKVPILAEEVDFIAAIDFLSGDNQQSYAFPAAAQTLQPMCEVARKKQLDLINGDGIQGKKTPREARLIGEVIWVTVTQVTTFGLFVDGDGIMGLILLPELSWNRISHPSEVNGVGDRIQCKIIHIPQGERMEHFVGSVRELYPENNPWSDPSQYVVGSTFQGIVEMKVDYGYFIIHPRKIAALLHVDSFPPEGIELRDGQELEVVITEVNLNNQTLRVELP